MQANDMLKYRDKVIEAFKDGKGVERCREFYSEN